MSQKPNYSSSSDDEEQQQTSGSEDEQSSGSDTDSDLPPKKPINKPKETKPPPPPPPPRVLAVVEKESNKIKQKNVTKPKPRASSSSESDSEESYTETDTESDKSKPSGLRKLVETKSVEKTGSKPVQVNNKRAVNDSGVVEKEAKKIKQKKIDSESESDSDSDSDSSLKKIVKVKAMELKSTGGKDVRVKSEKQLFQRLWSEGDEIVVLEGMIEYKNKNGENAIADMGAFHEFIKRKLHVDVSRAQLVDKVRRLKKKYVNNASREKDGKDRTFSNSHQQKGYELSKLIWGSNSNSNTNSNSKSKSKSKKKNQVQTSGVTSLVTSNGVEDKDKVMMEVEKNVDISRFVRYGGMSGSPIVSEEIVKGGLELVEGSKREELEGKWRKLKEQELEIYVKRMELLREQALVILDAVRSSGN